MAVDTADAQTTEHRRATVRPEKAAAVAEIAEAFRGAAAAVLTEYRGLTVKQISDLRVALGTDTTYSVVKNTLTKIAAADAGVTGIDALLEGPTAVAFIQGEPVQAAKALREFARANPVLVVKGGVMDGRTLTPEEITKLASLESREVLLAKMAGALLASLSNAAALFQAPLAQAARVVGALQAKAEEDPTVLGGGAGTPVAEAEPTPAEPTPADTGSGDTGSGDTGATDAPGAEEGAPEATAAEGVTPAERDDTTD